MLPAFSFVLGTLVFSIFLQSLGIILLTEMNYRTSDAVEKWRTMSVIFLVLYGIGPIFVEPFLFKRDWRLMYFI